MPELKPCPADYPPCPLCGKHPYMMESGHIVCCNIIVDDSDAWHSLPRALRWTTEPPTVAGWYWVRCTAADDFPIIKHVAQRDATAALLKREWAGPIKRLSSGAQRDLDAACESLAAHMMTEGTGPDLLQSWSAQYWTGFTMFLDARRRCTDFTTGRPWGWLERTGWSLGYLLMELATGCDVAGTDIFLEVA